MLKIVRNTGMVLILTATAVSVLYAFIMIQEEPFGAAIVFGVVGIGASIGWYSLFAWICGLRRKIVKHLQCPVFSFVEKKIPLNRVLDFRIAAEQWFTGQKGHTAQRVGAGLNAYTSLGNLQESDIQQSVLKWETIETEPDKLESFPSNAVYFLHWNDIPFVIRIRKGDAVNAYENYDEYNVHDSFGQQNSGGQLEILSRSLEETNLIISAITKAASLQSPLRGQLIHVSTKSETDQQLHMKVESRPEVDRDRIILRDGIFDVISRTLSSRLRHQLLLQEKGHSAKAGVLLHGPPGTGKTLVARYLVSVFENYTAIVVKEMNAATVRDAYQLANYLQPAMVVIEDVDLLAARRSENEHASGLQELMNEMDGLSASTAAITIMTTNRPEVLEPALAARPGRVSQAIQFPLPDDELRSRLIKMYCSDIDIRNLDIDLWVRRTAGASPAFLEELVKRAILFSAERNEQTALDLTNEDFDRAIHDLVVLGGNLTANVLGFPTGNLEDDEKSEF